MTAIKWNLLKTTKSLLMDNTEHSELLHLDDNFAIFKLIEE